MQRNPFKFAGPLDPVEDKIVCCPRSNEINKIIYSIREGDYWTILGPRQIGKTTFLRQIQIELSVFPSLYLDLEISPKTDKDFYDWLIRTLINNIVNIDFDEKKCMDQDYGPELKFLNFLKSIKLKENKKIVLLFDEIEKTPLVRSFLHIWRKVFHERYDQEEFRKYAVILAGSVDLVPLTIGETSPFNISKKLYLSDFSIEESGRLIDQPLKMLKIKIQAEARNKLILQTSGHPQILQHLCHILVEQFQEAPRILNEKDIDDAIYKLLIESDNIKILEKELKTNQILENLIKRILINRDKVEYLPYHDISITGTGPIKRKDNYCSVRNVIYEGVLKNILKDKDTKQVIDEDSEDIINIILLEKPANFYSIEDEEKFVSTLFNYKNLAINLIRKGGDPIEIELEGREKLIFCYLAYKNYKAIKKGFSNWKKIPTNYEFRLSSNIENNRQQVPEWNALVKTIGQEPYGDDLRSWIFSLRKNLEKIGAKDLIHSELGRGRGYLLKGKINFLNKNNN